MNECREAHFSGKRTRHRNYVALARNSEAHAVAFSSLSLFVLIRGAADGYQTLDGVDYATMVVDGRWIHGILLNGDPHVTSIAAFSAIALIFADAAFNADAGIKASMTERMFAQFKIEWRHDSEPAPDADKNDLRYVLGVGWDF